MKISKLFHWLYAILMLLPFVFFVPSVLYYAFNDNATMQSVEVPKTETISVDFNQQGRYLNTQLNGVTYTPNNSEFSMVGTLGGVPSYSQTILTQNITWKRDDSIYLIKIDTDYVDGRYGVSGYAPNGVGVTEFIWHASASSDWVGSVYMNTPNIVTFDNIFTVQIFDLTQMFGRGNEPTISQFNEWFTAPYYVPTQSEFMQITYDLGENEQLVQNTDIINYAWESIWDLPLFNWTKVTFVSVPFTYITGLFGVAASNSLNYVFGYFATISICWLVFDIIMYVPMLVHRWIDKARLE